MMKRLVVAVAASGLFVWSACELETGVDPAEVTGPEAIEPAAPSFSVSCYDNSDLVWAVESGSQYRITKESIAQGCGSEVCMRIPDADAVTLVRDGHPSAWYDKAIITCPDNSVHTVYSDNSCWHCWGCSAPWSCGGEEACDHEPGEYGWDCLGFNCPSGYGLYTWDEGTQRPRCRREWTAPECCDDGDCDAGYECGAGYCNCTTDPTCNGRTCTTNGDCANGTCGGGMCRSGTCMCPT